MGCRPTPGSRIKTVTTLTVTPLRSGPTFFRYELGTGKKGSIGGSPDRQFLSSQSSTFAELRDSVTEDTL